MELRKFTIDDYDEVFALWRASEGIGLGASDTRESIAAFLDRNPGLCLTARDGGVLAGAVLCGHDGRRGYLHHLAVSVAYRRRGVGRLLVKQCIQALATLGISRCHIFVFQANESARAFWEREGWWVRDDLWLMSREVSGETGPEAQQAQRGCSC